MTLPHSGRFVWGDRVIDSIVRGHPCHLYDGMRSQVSDLLEDARPWSDRIAVVHGDTRLTFHELEQAAHATAGQLRELGVKPGERVMITAANSVDWVLAFWGSQILGAVTALGNFWWSADEFGRAVADVEATLVLTDERRREISPAGTRALLLSDVARLEAGPTQQPHAADTDDPAVVIFTSGSSGRPKGALLSHRNVISAQHSLLLRTRRLPHTLDGSQPAAASLLTGPLFHLGGIGPLITALLVGGKVVFPRGRFDPHEILELIERERITTWSAVPTMVSRVLAEPDMEAFDTSSLRTIGLGGAPVPPGLPSRISSAFPTVVRGVAAMWGMTETSGLLASTGGQDALDHPGSTGRAIPVVELKVLDPDEKGIGELLARGPGTMLGYCNVDDDPIDADGFLHTGDVGRIDDDGYVYLAGRSKDVIIRGGENISASHVEDRLSEHPAVAEVAVVAVPHEELGEEVGAIVVLAPGSAASADELGAFARETLAYFEIPAHWQFRDTPLPTTPFGKVDKLQARAEWLDSAAV